MLGSYPRQNGLALPLRELGWIERTLFMLEWPQNPTLRQGVKAGLNKAEAKNVLARAVFFNRLGELRDRSIKNQRYRASRLNLAVAAIGIRFTSNAPSRVSARERRNRDRLTGSSVASRL